VAVFIEPGVNVLEIKILERRKVPKFICHLNQGVGYFSETEVQAEDEGCQIVVHRADLPWPLS